MTEEHHRKHTKRLETEYPKRRIVPPKGARTTRSKSRLHAVEGTAVYQSRLSMLGRGTTATLELSKSQRENREKVYHSPLEPPLIMA
ncbi:hypothetical protein F2Q69_00043923 [Brassica cretica]|uniref:Uncharacterized protein n=1 Tax=Brassica cretica TaxID=69181 RepID=A0A8S9NSJ8_BRACR|nr:hypothetical protein F2Q69_00043923 [Brassica cretica]